MGWDAVKNPTQQIYISFDKKKLLEIINNTVAIIYKGTTFDVLDDHQNFSHKKMFWQKESHI